MSDARPAATATPLRAVLRAAREGAGTTAEICRRTGLDPSVVDAALGHLRRTGRLEVLTLSLAPDCTACSASAGCAAGTGTGPAPTACPPGH